MYGCVSQMRLSPFSLSSTVIPNDTRHRGMRFQRHLDAYRYLIGFSRSLKQTGHLPSVGLAKIGDYFCLPICGFFFHNLSLHFS